MDRKAAVLCAATATVIFGVGCSQARYVSPVSPRNFDCGIDSKCGSYASPTLRNAMPDAKFVQNSVPYDVVAQVLNYSTFGQDEGYGNIRWLQDTADRCKYRFISSGRVIDLNGLDPRTITFNNTIDPNGNVHTHIYADADDLFLSDFEPPSLNIERLQRGWALIYSEYCRGKQKAF
jgi:hypothetical protein